MKRIDELSNLEQKQQKFYELGQFGMYNVLKDLEKQGLYLQPLIIGMLDNLIAATIKKVGNEEVALKVIQRITATYLINNNTKH